MFFSSALFFNQLSIASAGRPAFLAVCLTCLTRSSRSLGAAKVLSQ